jgi:hypothetical protein
VDPIHPIAPGPPSLSPAARLPVERLERISRERDRPSKDAQQRRHRQPPAAPEIPPDDSEDGGPEDEGRPHIDVRV